MLQVNLLLQAGLLLAAPMILFGSVGLLIFAALAGFNYGGILVRYISSAACIWGARQVGQVYGWLFSTNIPAAIFPLLAGYGYDRWQSFTIPLCIIAAMLVAAAMGALRLAKGLGPMHAYPRPQQQS
jgi:OFA family oxalate/formate antiporter-like MFS transporter